MAILAQDFDIISAMVKERSAIVLETGKEYLVESRLVPVAQAHGLRDLHQLAAAMKTSPNSALVSDVIDAMTTNETSFFRDIRPFEALRTTILPELVKARSSERSLTIWCGACSTGQEPYSIAMTVAEHFPELASWQVRIIGTDLSPTVVKQAERGVYTQLQVNRGVPAPLLVKYFDRKGMEWHIKPEIRRRVEFRTANLVAQWPTMPTVDLVMLRNVLIYFDNQAREQILRKAAGVMAPHGHLLLGSTESTIGLNVPFRREQVGGISTLRLAGSTPAGASPAASSVSRSTTTAPSRPEPWTSSALPSSPAGVAPAPRPLGSFSSGALAGSRTQNFTPKETRS
jgi:chemotaxis protein methyltransferase CheR